MAVQTSNLGREDKPNGKAKLFDILTGYAKESATYATRDVDYVLEEARLRGEQHGSRLKELKALLKSHAATGNDSERAELARDIRREAKEIRAFYEANPDRKKSEKAIKGGAFDAIFGKRKKRRAS